HTIETENWQLVPYSDALIDEELLALGLSAASLGDLALATKAAEKLAELSAASPNNLALRESARQVAGLTLFKHAARDIEAGMNSSGMAKRQESLALLAEAADVAEQGRLPNGAANPLKPSHELYGEVLLSADDPEMAVAMFEQSLLRTPNRSRSLLGAARAHRALGHEEVAAERYQALLANWSDDSLPAVREAKAFLGY
ncbi:MAG: hypothetical protein ACE37N_08550, partial [Pseudohongiellaceae bacterium]